MTAPRGSGGHDHHRKGIPVMVRYTERQSFPCSTQGGEGVDPAITGESFRKNSPSPCHIGKGGPVEPDGWDRDRPVQSSGIGGLLVGRRFKQGGTASGSRGVPAST